MKRSEARHFFGDTTLILIRHTPPLYDAAATVELVPRPAAAVAHRRRCGRHHKSVAGAGLASSAVDVRYPRRKVVVVVGILLIRHPNAT